MSGVTYSEDELASLACKAMAGADVRSAAQFLAALGSTNRDRALRLSTSLVARWPEQRAALIAALDG